MSFLGLSVIWGVAFNATSLPFFPLVVAGGIVTGLVGFWVRRAPDEEGAPFALTPRLAAVAVGVAVLHFAAGHALFAVAAQVLPSLTATALSVGATIVAHVVWTSLMILFPPSLG